MILLVTEKCNPDNFQRDGGARLVATLKKVFNSSLKIMQFGSQIGDEADWHFRYPSDLANRFDRRIANAEFIAQKVKSVESHSIDVIFTDVIFVHVSMQFGLTKVPLSKGVRIWTLPMFLSSSYELSAEAVPEEYKKLERLTLANSHNILTPSYLEKKQLIDLYQIPENVLHLVPRGIDTSFIVPKVRYLNGSPIFCSIGSIKPQKNTLDLIDLFANLLVKFPDSKLKIIGPIQNDAYYQKVIDKTYHLGLNNNVEFTGYLAPDQISSAIQECHIHISTSLCETFGRTIFETLASGLPNIARLENNGAADFLSHLPYIKFVSNNKEAVDAICKILDNLSELSEMATEIGELYDDKLLAKILAAKICYKETIAISDFDGTLFHKNDLARTSKCVEEFRIFDKKVICSARPIEDLLEQNKLYDLQADWIIAYSGAVVTDGSGQVLWITPLNQKDISKLKSLLMIAEVTKFQEELLQISIPSDLELNVPGLNVEIYQEKAFISNWQASKFRAINKLLNHIKWFGNIKTFGDGRYDREFLNYFDGQLIS
jgi:glycosyltransferase involved in cell wall biosynthesis